MRTRPEVPRRRAPGTLREALEQELDAQDVSLRGWCLRHGWDESFYVTVQRWYVRRRDNRNGRPYSLPLGTRLVLAAVLRFDGNVLTPAERSAFAQARALARPSSSSSSSQEGEED